MIWLLLACTQAPDEATALEPLEEALLLRRMSLDFRGVPPTLAELDQLEADPASLWTLRDDYLADERLEDRLVELLAQRWHTRVDEFEIAESDYHLEEREHFAFERAVGEEPLRLMARVAVEHRPWTDIVTSDTTVANRLLTDIWDLEGYPEDEEGWHEARYTDGRPAVGVLATNGLWWRYTTNLSNMNRARAAAIARLLLCHDPLGRPVSLDGAGTAEEGGTEAAISSEPGCVACHATLEPLSASLFGFWSVMSYSPDELSVYHPEREVLGERYLGVTPGYYGQPITGLAELGPAIANDSRFYRCAAEQAAELLWRREVALDDYPTVDALREGFLDDELDYVALLARVTQTPEYQLGTLGEGASAAQQERELPWRMLAPDQLASQVEALTGFSWESDGFLQLHNGEPGYRTLAGGVDGWSVTRPQQEPSLTWALVIARLSQAAASYAVERELEDGGERLLLQYVDLDDRPGDPDFDAELQELSLRLFAQPLSTEEQADVEAVWTELEASEGAVRAWRAVVSAWLRDARFVGY